MFILYVYTSRVFDIPYIPPYVHSYIPYSRRWHIVRALFSVFFILKKKSKFQAMIIRG